MAGRQNRATAAPTTQLATICIMLRSFLALALSSAALVAAQELAHMSISIEWADRSHANSACPRADSELVRQGLTAYAFRSANDTSNACGHCIHLWTNTANVTVQVTDVDVAIDNFFDLEISRKAFAVFQDYAVAGAIRGVSSVPVPCPP
ncbi:hypothetical protein SDRG_02943 [Saprolegnia diclina VS20]|uniref:Barwin domain-containing protein n=1 Tax=Saprolegnia diclina (strain VS20) TaxID=1156394 RepID=T0S3B5_SAPDV|nr:hypothetical protein SDRG_02943 [Saprolegnia diclina VS20]EQC39503.1 hypothetical protein SDRG_02943 [Saprolegnia diclina VS20]|eukprot:XP_008606775.1 hypothetical protein SDRG_02943 [Saprolegnia diclina VS20]